MVKEETSGVHMTGGGLYCIARVNKRMQYSFHVDILKGPLQLEEAHAAFIFKVHAIQNLHYTVSHISPERMQHLVENGQWSRTHLSKPTTL